MATRGMMSLMPVSAWLLVALAVPWQKEEVLTPGITYRAAQYHQEGIGPLSLHAIEFDPRTPGIDLVPVRALDAVAGKETVSSMAARSNAIAAINAAYFVVMGPLAGAPVAAYQMDGKLLSASSRQVATGIPNAPLSGNAERTALVICRTAGEEEKLEMNRVRFAASVTTAEGESTAIDGLNRPRGGDDLVLYTAAIGRTTRSERAGVEILVDAASIVARMEQGFGDMAIPAGGRVLSASGSAADWMRRNVRLGDTLHIRSGLTRNGCEARDVVAAGPLLVRDGQAVTESEGFRHEGTRNPRTAIARLRGGSILLLVADGRQAASIGLTTAELARILLSLGAEEAMNLDGGGSSTMVVRGRVVNSPSDRKERPVSDALVLRTR